MREIEDVFGKEEPGGTTTGYGLSAIDSFVEEKVAATKYGPEITGVHTDTKTRMRNPPLIASIDLW
jgi:hypothetical protein